MILGLLAIQFSSSMLVHSPAVKLKDLHIPGYIQYHE